MISSSRPRFEAHVRSAWTERRRWGVMTSDGIGPKGPRSGSSTDRGSAAEIGGEAASVIELSGAIKWFDVSKGYGFIVPDNGMPDILLHVTCLRRDGFQVAYEGARVVVEVLQRPRGLQAFRVLSIFFFNDVATTEIYTLSLHDALPIRAPRS